MELNMLFNSFLEHHCELMLMCRLEGAQMSLVAAVAVKTISIIYLLSKFHYNGLNRFFIRENRKINSC